MPLERIQPPGLKAWPQFTQVIKAGSTIYIAGQAAMDEEGHLVGRDDITAQTTQTFENVKKALASAGAGFSNLVKITVYATDVAFLQPIAQVRRQYLGSPDPVTSTFVVVPELGLPGFLVEIDGIAVLE